MERLRRLRKFDADSMDWAKHWSKYFQLYKIPVFVMYLLFTSPRPFNQKHVCRNKMHVCTGSFVLTFNLHNSCSPTSRSSRKEQMKYFYCHYNPFHSYLTSRRVRSMPGRGYGHTEVASRLWLRRMYLQQRSYSCNTFINLAECNQTAD